MRSVHLSREVVMNPRDLGARCDECPLGPNGCLRGDTPWRPVQSEVHQSAAVLAVLESPGPEDADAGYPLAGRSGTEWKGALSVSGLHRTQVDLTYTIACQLPGSPKGAHSRLDKEIDRRNKKRSSDERIPHPRECCTPRLYHIAQNYTNIIALGKESIFALTNSPLSVMNTRGGPMWVSGEWEHVDEGERRVFPTMAPDYVTVSPQWRPVFHADVAKAFRWFNGNLRWREPIILWRPSPEELEDWLDAEYPYWAYDVETDGIIATECGLRTVAIAVPDMMYGGRVSRPEQPNRRMAYVSHAVGITFQKINGESWYSLEDECEIRRILVEKFFADTSKIKVGHNAGFFDRLVIEHHFGVTPAPLWDTLFAARFRAPDLPKGLKVVGSVLTDVERWETTEKGDKAATGSGGDDNLLRYNCIDAVVNVRITAPLVDASEMAHAFDPLPLEMKPPGWDNKRWDLWTVDHATQDMCVEMHKAGIWVDQAKRFELETKFEHSVRQRLKRIKDMTTPDFNPGSGIQVRNLLYGTWKLECPPRMDSRTFFTESGLPGTGDAVIRGHLASGLLDENQENFLTELRLYRRERNKILGTVLRPMQLRSMDPELGIVFDDGRVRSNWNAHVTSVGRLSSSGPNLQNIGNRKGQGPLKSIFAAPPGRIFVGADLDQAHLKITANYWRIPILLEAFTEGKDPHNTLAYAIFGSKFKHADGWGPEGFSLYRKPQSKTAKAMRDVIKTFRYASIYWASPDTVWQVLTSTETDDGKMPYLFMEPREVRVFHNKWLESEPEWMSAWQDMLRVYEMQGFMREPVFGRCSGPLSDGKKNEVVNFPILAAESSLMRVAEQRIIHRYAYSGDGCGLIHQCHDSVAVEMDLPPGLPADWKPTKGEPLPREIQEAKEYVEWAMTVNVPGWEVPITAEADVGRTLKDV